MSKSIEEIEKDFIIEKNAKNTAIAFILSKGLLEEYRTFSSTIQQISIDPFEIVQNLIYNIAIENNIISLEELEG